MRTTQGTLKPVSVLLIWGLFGISLSAVSASVYAESGCTNLNSGMEAMHQEEISIINGQGKIVRIKSYIADDNEERASGYQHICKSVIDKTTILFVYTKSVSGRFHMRNVKSALDIGFFDDRGVLIKSMLMETYGDGNSRLYYPDEPFRFALEAKPGFFSARNLSVGKTRLLIYSLYDEN